MQYIKFRKGFGVLEVLISAVIVIMVLGALVSVGRLALASTGSYRERSQAIYLAQEGLEIVRQIRDTNWIDDSTVTVWGDLKTDTNKKIEWNDTATDSATGNRRGYRLIDGQDEIITVNNTEYKRTITLSALTPISGADNEGRVVTITVSWGTKSISMSETLTNWRPEF